MLNVEEGGKARFLSSVSMDGVGVDTIDLADMKHGGCVYNQVRKKCLYRRKLVHISAYTCNVPND